jgi:perosamine synthetase
MLSFLSLQHPASFGRFARLVASLGLDHDLVIRRMTKGFGSQDFFEAIRKRPCAPLLECMLRRLSDYPAGRIAARAQAASLFFERLSGDVATFGLQAERHNHWIVPIRVANRAEVIAALREAGFDATAASSTLTVIDPPDGRAAPERARLAMRQLVYLPAYPEAGEQACEEMADIVNATAQPADTIAAPHDHTTTSSKPAVEQNNADTLFARTPS